MPSRFHSISTQSPGKKVQARSAEILIVGSSICDVCDRRRRAQRRDDGKQQGKQRRASYCKAIEDARLKPHCGAQGINSERFPIMWLQLLGTDDFTGSL